MDEPPSVGDELLRRIQHVSGAYELRQITTFRGYRKAPDGADREIRIEIHDAGPAAALRWFVVARDEADGLEATGNPGNDLNLVLASVHWYDLDS